MAEWILPEINLERCDRCELCIFQCPTAALAMTTTGPAIVHPEQCTYCAECEALCPQQAITCRFEIVWETV